MPEVRQYKATFLATVQAINILSKIFEVTSAPQLQAMNV